MKPKRFREEQINRTCGEHELGCQQRPTCRKLGISEPSFYNSKVSSADWTCPKPAG
jgi:hypothetical protein